MTAKQIQIEFDAWWWNTFITIPRRTCSDIEIAINKKLDELTKIGMMSDGEVCEVYKVDRRQEIIDLVNEELKTLNDEKEGIWQEENNEYTPECERLWNEHVNEQKRLLTEIFN